MIEFKAKRRTKLPMSTKRVFPLALQEAARRCVPIRRVIKEAEFYGKGRGRAREFVNHTVYKSGGAPRLYTLLKTWLIAAPGP